MDKNASYEELVQACKQARDASERAEAAFFLLLMAVETQHAETWKAAGIEEFEQFISSNGPLCQPQRYRLFCVGCARIGIEAAAEHGAHFTIEAGKVRDVNPRVIVELMGRASAFREVHGVAPSEQASREWRKEVDQPQEEHRTVKAANELGRLRAENEKLRADLRVARARITELEKLAGVRAKAVRGASGARTQRTPKKQSEKRAARK